MGAASHWVRWPDGQNSPRLYALLPLVLRRWRANAGKSCPAILAAKRRKGRLDAMGLTIPPAWPCHAVPPLHKGGLRRAAAGKTLFAWMDTTGLARERSMGAASRRQSLSRRSPTAPFAQGSHLCLGKYNRLSAGAQYGCSVTLPRLGREKGRGSGGRTAILSLPFCIGPAWRGSAVRLPRHWAQNNTPPIAKKTSPTGKSRRACFYCEPLPQQRLWLT